jgi:hypothetical protein
LTLGLALLLIVTLPTQRFVKPDRMRDFSWIRGLPVEEQNKILSGPAMQPPLGITATPENPPNYNELVVATVVIVAVVTGTLLGLRLYSRLKYHRSVHVEDCKPEPGG